MIILRQNQFAEKQQQVNRPSFGDIMGEAFKSGLNGNSTYKDYLRQKYKNVGNTQQNNKQDKKEPNNSKNSGGGLSSLIADTTKGLFKGANTIRKNMTDKQKIAVGAFGTIAGLEYLKQRRHDRWADY